MGVLNSSHCQCEELLRYFCDIENLHDGLDVVFIRLWPPLAAWLQEPVDGWNLCHPALERLERNAGSGRLLGTGCIF